jgi:hypothetical protein
VKNILIHKKVVTLMESDFALQLLACAVPIDLYMRLLWVVQGKFLLDAHRLGEANPHTGVTGECHLQPMKRANSTSSTNLIGWVIGNAPLQHLVAMRRPKESRNVVLTL